MSNDESAGDSIPERARAWARLASAGVRAGARALLDASHNGLALVGLAAVALGAFAYSRPDLVQRAETVALEWLQIRHEQREMASGNVLAGMTQPDAAARATAADLAELPKDQAAVAQWLARRYRVAAEPLGALVHEAWQIGQRAGLEPTLILAIMAIESSFNPFAQSHVGAQGLMQVMTRVHGPKFTPFGGTEAAFDPIANLRVGVQVLKECIARAGSVQDGLRYYVGAALREDDGGYAMKVMAEQNLLQAVAAGKRVPVSAPAVPPAPAEPPKTAAAPVAPTVAQAGAAAPLATAGRDAPRAAAKTSATASAASQPTVVASSMATSTAAAFVATR